MIITILQIIVFFGAIFLGSRVGGIGFAFMGGLGVLLLVVLGAEPAEMPLMIVGIIISVMAAVAVMQAAGGMDYLVQVAGAFLRKHPKQLNFLAPAIAYFMSVLAGTGFTVFTTFPVIVEVAKQTNMPPSRPLSLAGVASQIAITAAPVSAPVIVMASLLEETNSGFDYVTLLAVTIPATFIAVFAGVFIMLGLDKLRGAKPLDQMKVYQERLAKGLVSPPQVEEDKVLPKGAKASVWIIMIAILIDVAYSFIISDVFGLVANPPLSREMAITAIMLAAGALIMLLYKIPAPRVSAMPIFKSGMVSGLCILGVAWMGSTFIGAHAKAVETFSDLVLTDHPWLLAVILVLAGALLYSQTATTKAIMPTALSAGVGGTAVVAAFPAVSSLFILPTYPTLLAAVEMDDTGTTRVGKYVFNHPFLVPTLVMIGVAVAVGFPLAAMIGG